MRLKVSRLLVRATLFGRCPFPVYRVLSQETHNSSYEEGKRRRNEIFNAEKKHQRESVGRVEKIVVKYYGMPEDATLAMNKGISTPYNCAQHLSEMLVKRSALAVLDNVTLWDMHRPLEASCSLKLLHFKDSDPHHVNKAFWRTCSIILGAVVSDSFKENVRVSLHSFPPPNVRSGSFIYDVELGLPDWNPTKDELRILSGVMVDFCNKGYKVERLPVFPEVALNMFADNPHKTQQIPDIASQSPNGKVVLYRIGDHVDISRGPLVGDTNVVGRCSIVAVHQIQGPDKLLYRFQGVALPQGFLLNHFAYGILENRAQRLNMAGLEAPAQEVAVA